MPRELDWNTPLGKVSIGAHWRLLLCVVLCSVIATFIWHACFPHTLWFTKLCTGFATGAALGMIPGTWWQLHDVERRPITSGYLVLIGIFGWGFFAGISLVFEAPDLRAQESERSRIRSLSVADISSISVHMEGRRPLKIEDADRIASFVGRAAIAELFYPSHEGSAVEFQIVIDRNDGTSLKYEGRVPERHRDDFSLKFHGFFGL